MNKFLKITVLAATLTSVMAMPAFAAQIGSAKVGYKTGGIQGFRPYMAAIGSRVVSSNVKDGDINKAAVGAVIEVPTYLTDSELFQFVDADKDAPAGKGYALLPNGEPAKKEFRVEWYIIEADDWNTVTSWDQLKSAVKIDTAAIGAGDNTDNKNSVTLVVPESAVGKRLGFIAYPESETGTPSVGSPVKAWDLSKIWTQEEVKEPGECAEGDKTCEDNGQGNGGDNENGGGGIVLAPEFAITLYDDATKEPLVEDSKLFVNHDYFATIRIKEDKEGVISFRDPTPEELATLKWHVIDGDGNSVAVYDEASGRLGISDDKFGIDQLTKYTFKTQLVNSDASTSTPDLTQIDPNFSEQGFGLYVTLGEETAE